MGPTKNKVFRRHRLELGDPLSPTSYGFHRSSRKRSRGVDNAAPGHWHAKLWHVEKISMGERIHWGSVQGVEGNALIILEGLGEGDELGNITKNRGDTRVVIMYIEH